MQWVTRQNAKVDRVACPWLIRRFIDSEALFLFVPAEQVLEVARQRGAHSFDADGAEYRHSGGGCTFETLIDSYKLQDPALQGLARIVHGADIPQDIGAAPEAAGLRAIAEGMARLCPDDHRKLELLFPVYDALYAFCGGSLPASV